MEKITIQMNLKNSGLTFQDVQIVTKLLRVAHS